MTKPIDSASEYRPLSRPKNDRPFQVLFSVDTFAQLQALSQDAGVSSGALIRRLVRHAFDMQFSRTPCCATGATCLVPQLHFRDGSNG